METIKNFDDLIAHLSQKGERKRVAIVWASDDHTQEQRMEQATLRRRPLPFVRHRGAAPVADSLHREAQREILPVHHRLQRHH